MNRLIMIERIRNRVDFGYFREVFLRSLKKKVAMGPRQFLSQLFRARGFSLLTPPEYEALVTELPGSMTIDLREKRQFETFHIPGSVSHPFDDFLGEVLMGDRYRERRLLPLFLVCDTGHMSRVAASILKEEGFNRLYSLDRGMRRMKRWYRLQQLHRQAEDEKCPVCHEVFASLDGATPR